MAITRYTKFNQTRYINITNMDDLKFIPVPYELPIFIKKRVNIRKGGIRTHTKLMNHLANYKQYYQEDGKRKRMEMVEFPNFKCEKPNKKMENKSWVPPPNQYTVKYDSLESRMKKQMGKHGPFMCFTVPRDDTTVIGNEHKADGADAYYHIPGSVEEMSWKKNFYKGKISRIDRTKLKATSRNMVNDLNLCNKDPKAPGPCTYNLTNHIIKQL